MNRRKRHKAVEFHIDTANGTTVFPVFEQALGLACARACSTGEPVNVDVCIWSEAGARWWSGDDGVTEYRDDPDASVFERIVIRAESIGRIA